MAAGKAGGVWTHDWTYQGYRVHGGMFRRSPGLHPEGGYVDIDYDDLGSLKVDAGPFWPGGGPGPKDIRAWSKSRVGQTTTTGGSGGGNAGGGLKRFGPLVMVSSFKGKPYSSMVYQDIFVDSGTEEITRGLSDARSHSKGKVRVQLTDIRSTYKHGAFFGRINCRMQSSGKRAHNTTKDGKGRLWTVQDVFELMFSELPGSPGIHPSSAIYAATFAGAPPSDLVGEGEPIRHVLEQLLNRYGIVARLLPDNSYFLDADLGGDYSVGSYAEAVGSSVQAEHIREERKSVSFSEARSAAVMVVGKKRIRQITVPYVPVIKDPKSGRILPMTEANCAKIGMPLKDVQGQVFRNPEKSFRNVEPKKKREGAFLRRKMFQDWAYRVYAPAFAFDTEKKSSGGMLEEEFRDLPFMPMHEAPWLRKDLETHGLDPKSKKSGSGPLGEWTLFPPVVRAAGFRQGFFQDFKAVKDFFKLMQEGDKKAVSFAEGEVKRLRDAIVELGTSLSKADHEMAKRYGDDSEAAPNLFIKLGEDVAVALGESSAGSASTLSDAMNAGALEPTFQKAILQQALKTWESLVEKNIDVSRKTSASFKSIEETFAEANGLQLWGNQPHGPMEEGAYSIDENTGLITFNQLMCLAEQPFLLQPEGAVAAADGNVFVTYGYEINNNILSDFTSVIFTSNSSPSESVTDGPSSIGQVGANGMNRSCSLKPVVEKDPNMRLYENSAGEAYNVTEVVSQAASRAMGQLSIPRAAVGYTYVLQGLRKAVLDAGVSSVQHEYDGKIASTHISINSLGARGPLGPANANAGGPRWAADAREDIGRSEEGR